MRLIDADAAIEQIDDIFSIAEDKGLLPAGIVKAIVRNMLHLEAITPTVEAVPVRRGKWIERWFGYGYKVRCSKCGCLDDKRTDYCPNCGAKMEHDA
jgi:hypothetical protein